MSTTGRFIPEIDGLRFIAIATVVIFHLAVNLEIKNPDVFTAVEGTALWIATRAGTHGVELFFVISGFVLALPFAEHRLLGTPRVPLGAYFLRRVTRLEPPYLLSMIVFFSLLVLARGEDASDLLPHLIASLGYLHSLLLGTESLINNVAWSLEVEIQFYLLVPLLTFIFAIRQAWIRHSILLSAMIAWATLAHLLIAPATRPALSLLNFAHFFLGGFLLADLHLTRWRHSPKSSYKWDLVSLTAWPLVAITLAAPTTIGLSDGPRQWSGVPRAISFLTLTLLLVTAAFRGRLTRIVLTRPVIVVIGGMCYTIYLLHNPIMNVALGVTKSFAPTDSYALNLLAQGLLLVPPIMMVCLAFFVLIERPCMRRDWPRRLALRWRKIRNPNGAPSSDDPTEAKVGDFN